MKNMKYPKSELFETLADIEHQRWADWQKYMHSKCVKMIDVATCPESGISIERLREVVIPAELYERWEKQINTPYSELSEKEKNSDRDQVLRYWKLMEYNLPSEYPSSNYIKKTGRTKEDTEYKRKFAKKLREEKYTLEEIRKLMGYKSVSGVQRILGLTKQY